MDACYCSIVRYIQLTHRISPQSDNARQLRFPLQTSGSRTLLIAIITFHAYGLRSKSQPGSHRSELVPTTTAPFVQSERRSLVVLPVIDRNEVQFPPPDLFWASAATQQSWYQRRYLPENTHHTVYHTQRTAAARACSFIYPADPPYPSCQRRHTAFPASLNCAITP